MDYVDFSVMGKYCTILTWNGKISIGEWDKPETVKNYTTISEMLEMFKIDGISLINCIDQIKIINFN